MQNLAVKSRLMSQNKQPPSLRKSPLDPQERQSNQFHEMFEQGPVSNEFIMRVAKLPIAEFRNQVGKLTGITMPKRANAERYREELLKKFIEKYSSHPDLAPVAPYLSLAVPVVRQVIGDVVTDIHVLCVALEEDDPSADAKLLLSCRLFSGPGADPVLVRPSTVGEDRASGLLGQSELLSIVQELRSALAAERESRIRETSALSMQLGALKSKLEALSNEHADLSQKFSKFEKLKYFNILNNDLNCEQESMEIAYSCQNEEIPRTEKKRKHSPGENTQTAAAGVSVSGLAGESSKKSCVRGDAHDGGSACRWSRCYCGAVSRGQLGRSYQETV